MQSQNGHLTPGDEEVKLIQKQNDNESQEANIFGLFMVQRFYFLACFIRNSHSLEESS